MYNFFIFEKKRSKNIPFKDVITNLENKNLFPPNLKTIILIPCSSSASQFIITLISITNCITPEKFAFVYATDAVH